MLGQDQGIACRDFIILRQTCKELINWNWGDPQVLWLKEDSSFWKTWITSLKKIKLSEENESSGWNKWINWFKRYVIRLKRMDAINDFFEIPMSSGWSAAMCLGFRVLFFHVHVSLVVRFACFVACFWVPFGSMQANVSNKCTERVGGKIKGCETQLRNLETQAVINIDVFRLWENGIHHPWVQNQ